jgi:uncharacterized protein YlzI (FlbEa/FlbD family)
MKSTRQLITVAALFVAIVVAAQAAVASDDHQGFLYGRVLTESGSEYTGFLRWGSQEAFWDDLFHSGKEDLPYLDELDDDEIRALKKSRRRGFSLFRDWGDHYDVSRMFIARFGDIEKIEPMGEGEADVRMKNGNEYEVSGVADDVTSKIHVNDNTMGKIELHWDRLESIEFMPVPKSADPGVWRLHGKVITDEGDFEGYIQWDKQECINTDKLDGDTDDGDVSIEMGRIRSIESNGRRSSTVTLRDGRSFKLSGSNDVNNENRGIMVEDPRYGRVTVHWKAFEIITFSEPGKSGKGYNDYPARGPLQGTVTDDRGNTYKGRIVIDLDEAEGWEILNGDVGHVEFDIPIYRIATLEPRGRDETRVTLTNGEKLVLEDGQDVTDDNAGVLVIEAGKEAVYIEWDDVEKIEFDHK